MNSGALPRPAATASTALLELQQLEVCHGALTAVSGLSLQLQAGEQICLIGANGAGKSSTLAAIAGSLPLAGGRLLFDGRDIGRLRADQRLRLGIAFVPEGRGIFAQLSVGENLRLGSYSRRDHAAIAQDMSAILQRLPRLRERLQQRAGTLSGGEQQMLALARALLARPRLLLLDEPSLGLAPRMIDEVYAFIAEIRQRGVSILLVEQNTSLALQDSTRAYLLSGGSLLASGRSSELRHHPLLEQAYLGRSD